jgi:EpsI family protein
VNAANSFAPSRRQIILGGTLISAAGAVALLRPQRSYNILRQNALNDIIPRTIGPYMYASSTGLVVPDAVPKREYDQVLTRIYVANDRPAVMLLIAYGSAQDASLALHRPESCYPAAGYELGKPITADLRGTIEKQQAITMTAARQDRIEQLYYWTRVGSQFPTSQTEQDWAIFAANLHGTLPAGVLVRLSVRSTDRDAALSQMMMFNGMLLRASGIAGRRLLLGEGHRE